MVFYGASGHAKVIIESWVATGGDVTAVFDDNLHVKKILQYNVEGPYVADKFAGIPLVIAVGNNLVRKKIASGLMVNFGKVIHPGALVSPSCAIGEGSVFMAGAIINADTKIGKHVIVNTASSIDHDCIIEDYVHISPHASICGGVHIGEGTHVGAGATVIPNVKIGKWVTIGAGSVIVNPIPDFAVVKGVPGKIARFNKIQ